MEAKNKNLQNNPVGENLSEVLPSWFQVKQETHGNESSVVLVLD